MGEAVSAVTDLSLLLRWALITLGFIYFITESSIFAVVRMWIAAKLGTFAIALLYCASCSGFWIGMALAFWTWPFEVVGVRWLVPFESGVAAMALGAVWNTWRGPNPAFVVEIPAPEHGDDYHDDASQSEASTRSEETTHDGG